MQKTCRSKIVTPYRIKLTSSSYLVNAIMNISNFEPYDFIQIRIH